MADFSSLIEEFSQTDYIVPPRNEGNEFLLGKQGVKVRVMQHFDDDGRGVGRILVHNGDGAMIGPEPLSTDELRAVGLACMKLAARLEGK